mmetsp:Transcript_13939/g.35073  ORF Transcript_13939/g.35073 Transcript_13939/m.35073 type:complete len:324 (-) Transcript_13939:157-1128(-)
MATGIRFSLSLSRIRRGGRPGGCRVGVEPEAVGLDPRRVVHHGVQIEGEGTPFFLFPLPLLLFPVVVGAVISGLQLGSFYDEGACDSAQLLAAYGDRVPEYCPCNSGAKDVFYKAPRVVEGSNRSAVLFVEPFEAFFFATCGAEPEAILEALVVQSDSKKLTGVIVGIIGVIALLAALAGIFVYRHIRLTRQEALMSTWKIDYDELHFEELLGLGASGKTYHGRYKGTEVVIKQLDREEMDAPNSAASASKRAAGSVRLGSKSLSNGKSSTSGGMGGLQHEIQMLYKLRHPNIRLFMGAHIGQRERKTWGSKRSISSFSNLSR